MVRRVVLTIAVVAAALALVAVAAERTAVRDVRAGAPAEVGVHIRVVRDRVQRNGLRVIDGVYRSPYGRAMRVEVLAPRRPARRLPFVWRFAPSFWMRARKCQPFVRAQPARWGFVYACVGIDDRTGWRGDHAFGDPRALREALRLRPAVERLVRARPTREILIGSSASSVDALDAIGIEPRRFSDAIVFDSPANLAARYWDLASGPRAHTRPEYGGPPTGRRRVRYLDRSPIARVPELARATTDIRFYVSRTDAVSCDPQQMPVMLRLLARDRGRAVPVMVGTWRHGTGWSRYADYELQRLGIAPASARESVPHEVRVGAGIPQHALCSPLLR